MVSRDSESAVEWGSHGAGSTSVARREAEECWTS